MFTDPVWLKALLGVHVLAGMTAFVLAPVALMTAKGGKTHKRWGKVYFYAMLVVAGTALPLAIWRPVLFLALVSVLAAYLIFSGTRVLKLKDLARGGSAQAIDWIAAIVAFTTGAVLAYLGWFHPAVLHAPAGIVAVILGAVIMRSAAADMYLFYRKPTEKMFWWYGHLAKFLGSYIAAWTAFSTATLSHIFTHAGLILWLWPITVGFPAIFFTTMYYKRKFAPRVPAAMPAAAA